MTTKTEAEAALRGILETARDADLDADDVIRVEMAAQQIHAVFGGTEPDAIYPEGEVEHSRSDANGGERR